jgi:enolase
MLLKSIQYKAILNNQLTWTNEFRVEGTDGRVGLGSAPLGETPSIYEVQKNTDPNLVCRELLDQMGQQTLTQGLFDEFLESKHSEWGQGTIYALSIAFANATELWKKQNDTNSWQPSLLVNLLNGGRHAYTLPVRSDFPEFLLVPKQKSLEQQINIGRRLLYQARETLLRMETCVVNGNQVCVPSGEDNDAVLDLIHQILDESGIEDDFQIMIDASGGDMVSDHGYQFLVSGRDLSTDEMVDFWVDFAGRWKVGYLEDPLGEQDEEAWTQLRARLPETCKLVADNLVSGNVEYLHRYADFLDAVIVKPDQCGTVSNAIDFVAAAKELGLEMMVSHRSVETDELALVKFARLSCCDHIKIGPLLGFESILKVNELIRHSY